MNDIPSNKIDPIIKRLISGISFRKQTSMSGKEKRRYLVLESMEAEHNEIKQRHNGIEQRGHQIQGVLKDSLQARALLASQHYLRPVKKKKEIFEFNLQTPPSQDDFLTKQLDLFFKLHNRNLISYELWKASKSH